MSAPAGKVSLVIPCYNEEEAIGYCIAETRRLMADLIAAGKVAADSQVVLVNDGSRDGTWREIEKVSAADPLFAGINLSRNYGHQYALLCGLLHADGDALVSMDADLQDDPRAVEAMIDQWRAGHDVVYGVRQSRDTDTFFKRTSALFFYRLLGWLGVRSVYNHADYRLLSRRAVEALREFGEANLYLRGLIPLLGFPSASVTYDRQKRVAGESKYPLLKMLALSLNAITAHSSYPLRLITMTAGVGILITFGIACWALYVRIFTERGVPGWTSILLPVLFIGSLNLLATGVAGEYIARIFDEVKGRPRFLIAGRLRLPPR
jgi:polyisoprenyl-phosphate glycosyltransferase